jgi:hypothetical protein
MDGEASIPKTTLHVLPEGKKRKRKTNENMERPAPRNQLVGDRWEDLGVGGRITLRLTLGR